MKIFIAGLRAIKELDKNISVKLENICAKNYEVLVEDADGIDSSIQKLLQIGLEEQYYKFYDEKLKEIAIKWCEENNLEYEE